MDLRKSLLTGISASLIVGVNCLQAGDPNISGQANQTATQATAVHGKTLPEISAETTLVDQKVETSQETAQSANKEVTKVEEVAKCPYSEDEVNLLLQTLGFFMGMQSGLRNFGLDEKQLSHVIEGLKIAHKGGKSPTILGESSEKLQVLLPWLTKQNEKAMAEQLKVRAAENQKLADTFFENLKKTNKNIKILPSGVIYEIIELGDEKLKPSELDMIEFDYIGKLPDGTIFDKSGEVARPFPVRALIPGMREALPFIGKGGKIIIYIPSNQGYGDQDIPGIGPNSALIFELTLRNIIQESQNAIPEIAPVSTDEKASPVTEIPSAKSEAQATAQ